MNVNQVPSSTPLPGVSKPSNIQQMFEDFQRTKSDNFSKFDDKFFENKTKNTQNIVSPKSPQLTDLTQTRIKFPDSFDPRAELNMPQEEKVEKWIKLVPSVPTNKTCNTWISTCYNPHIPTCDQLYEDDEAENCNSFDFGNDADVIQYQSKLITFLINKNYYFELENVRGKDGKIMKSGNWDLYDNSFGYNDLHHVIQFEQFNDYNLG